MELPSELKQALERLQAGITDAADLETLRRALQAGQIALTTGERAVALGGSVEDTVIVTGDNNIVFKGATAESVREALQKVLERIASDRYAASLQEYFHALRRYCAELPYLTLTDIRPPKNLDEVYVPLQARQRESEPLPRGPAAQGASLTVEQVLRQAQTPHLLILGQPGAGKSTLLRQLAERAYDAPHATGLDRPHLPLLLPLRALARAEGALEERLNQALQNELRLTRPLPAGFLDAWPQQLDTPWLFLLDGLDEVSADMYLSLRQWNSDLLTRPDVARVIITSRPSAYTEKEWESSRLSVYEIQPFTPDQTAELARRWFGEDAPAFLQALETVRSSVLTETPLLVTIAAKVYLERKRLSERRAQLYQEFVDIWLDEARERGLRDELGADVLDLAQPSLAHLALAMTEHPEWTDEKSLIPVVAKYLDEQLNLKARASAVAERFLRVMARRSGMFLKREEQYEWVHPTFREYFVARVLDKELCNGKTFADVLGERPFVQKTLKDALKNQLHEQEWREIIVLLAEICQNPIELVIWMSREAVARKAGQTAFLVKRCWEVSDAKENEQAHVAVEEALTVALLTDPETVVRHAAADELAEIGGKRTAELITNRESLNRLLGLEEAPSEPLIAQVRWNLMTFHPWGNPLGILISIGKNATESLLSILESSILDARLNAIYVLGEIRDPRAIKPLMELIRDTNDKDVLELVFSALAKIGVPALDGLLDLLKHDTDPTILRHIAKALGKIGDSRGVDPLLSMLHYTPIEVQQQAIESLGKLGDTRATEPLIANLSNPQFELRKKSVEALGLIKDKRALKPLIKVLKDRSPEVRASAAISLGKMCSDEATKALISALRDPEASIRQEVAKALGEIKDTHAINALIKAFQDSKIEVGRAARNALVGIGTPAVKPLINALNNHKMERRWLVADALGEIGDVEAIEPLSSALFDSDPYVQE
jgi:HEAT repeat protein